MSVYAREVTLESITVGALARLRLFLASPRTAVALLRAQGRTLR